MRRVAILQSNYIPWKGYFDLINSVDEFIVFDDMQYTRRDWRNRNRIKGPNGPLWLTIPVQVKGRYNQRIDETRVADSSWARKHWLTLQHTYGRAPHFSRYEQPLGDLYRGIQEEFLSRVNHKFLTTICGLLDIRSLINWSTDYESEEGKTDRLVHLCRQAGAGEYLSGPTARDYLDESLFHAAAIGLRYIDYSNYPEYEQLYAPFDHHVSVLDLLFNKGPDARKYLLSTPESLNRRPSGTARELQ